jgi:hypothetical protein
MITHPTGGAVIGPVSIAAGTNHDDRLVFDPDRQRAGVVDERGRVYDVSSQDANRPYYEGLYVADAAIIPTSVGVNPSLTISALALRVVDAILEEHYRDA